MKEKINRDSLVRKYMRKITMASNASLICCDYGDYGVMVESQGEHYDVIGLLGAFIVMYSQKYGYDTDEIKKEVNSAIEIIKEQEADIVRKPLEAVNREHVESNSTLTQL